MKGKNVLMVVLAGGLFAGGLAAPDSWRSAVQNKISSLTGQQPADKAQSAEPSPQAKPSKPEKKKSAPPVPLASIQQPLALAKGQALGLGLGLFTTQEAANARIEQVAALGYVTRIVAIKDKQGDVWYLPIVGEYDEKYDMQREQSILAETLVLEQAPEIVLIPPVPKK